MAIIIENKVQGVIKATPISEPINSETQLYYNSSKKAWSYQNNISGVEMNIGHENWIRVKNITGSTIPNGSVVYINGSDGSLPTVALALADSESTLRSIALTTSDILNNAESVVTIFGEVGDLNTNSFNVGDLLYVSPTTPGGFVNVEPIAPYFIAPMGVVQIKNATTGKVNIITGTVRAALNGKIDRKSASASSTQNTTSSTFVDMPDMSLVTGDLGETGKYEIKFTGSFEHSNNNIDVSAIINVDGSDVADSEMIASRSTANGNFVITTLATINIAATKTIKVRWKTPSGTATVVNRILTIDGVALSNII